MNLAVLLHQDTPNELNVPGQWPSECRELGESTQLPSDGKPWVLMSLQEYNDHRATHQASWDNWYQTVFVPYEESENALDEIDALLKQANEFPKQSESLIAKANELIAEYKTDFPDKAEKTAVYETEIAAASIDLEP